MPERLTPKLEQSLGLTEREQLFNRISNERLKTLLNDDQTTIHRVEVSTNNYGEFLFVTVSQAPSGGEQRDYLSFWGLGFHDYRERWIIDEWFYYSLRLPEPLTNEISKETAKEQIRQREDEVAHYGTPDIQSQRGKTFEMLADLMDEDGAWAEMEDLGDLLDDDFRP